MQVHDLDGPPGGNADESESYAWHLLKSHPGQSEFDVWVAPNQIEPVSKALRKFGCYVVYRAYAGTLHIVR